MKRASERPSPVPGGAAIFQRLYTRLGCRGRPPRFEVEFYPYANLMHTIRLREESACVRISDALRGAPLAVLESAAAILLSRVYRRRAPVESSAHIANSCSRRALAAAWPRFVALGAAVSRLARADRFTIWRPCSRASTANILAEGFIARGLAGAPGRGARNSAALIRPSIRSS